METEVKEEGTVMIPDALRRQLGIKKGDRLRAEIRDGNIVLLRSNSPQLRSRIVKDPLTGLPV